MYIKYRNKLIVFLLISLAFNVTEIGMNQILFENLITEFDRECRELFNNVQSYSMELEHEALCDLMEHRGAPDPQKVRERQQAHKRGIERHRNALERERQTEKNRRERQSKVSKHQEITKQQRKQQLRNKLENLSKSASVEKGKQLTVINDGKHSLTVVNKQNQPKSKEDAEKKVSVLTSNLTKTSKQINSGLRKFVNTAPSPEAKNVALSVKKNIDTLSKNDMKLGNNADTLSKLSPQERKRRKEKELEEIAKKHEGKLTDKERTWFRKHYSEISETVTAASDNFFDLCGIKAVYDDVWKATNYVTGGAASKLLSKSKGK